jgi:hypothetical protein
MNELYIYSLYIAHALSKLKNLCKSENKKAEQDLSEDWQQWEARGGRKRGRRVNMVQILSTYVCKWKKMRPVKLFQE